MVNVSRETVQIKYPNNCFTLGFWGGLFVSLFILSMLDKTLLMVSIKNVYEIYN